MLLVAFFTAAGIVAIDVAGLTDEAYRASFGGERLAYSFTLLRIAALTLMLLVAGLLGYWRGQKYRLSKYLHYLLGVLPAETRDAVIELAFEEAQKAPAATGRARISAT